MRGTVLHAWDFRGYGETRAKTHFPGVVTVRTPRSTIAALRAGYEPVYHPTAAPARKESS